jgi:hypothetical protein
VNSFGGPFDRLIDSVVNVSSARADSQATAVLQTYGDGTHGHAEAPASADESNFGVTHEIAARRKLGEQPILGVRTRLGVNIFSARAHADLHGSQRTVRVSMR